MRRLPGDSVTRPGEPVPSGYVCRDSDGHGDSAGRTGGCRAAQRRDSRPADRVAATVPHPARAAPE